MSLKFKSLIAASISLALSPIAFAKDSKRVGSPDSTEQVIEDHKHSPRIGWKESIEKNYG